jgi:hypothetical protein
MTEKWEYKRISNMPKNLRKYLEELEVELNALGAAGWELVTSDQGAFTLKRRRND